MKFGRKGLFGAVAMVALFAQVGAEGAETPSSLQVIVGRGVSVAGFDATVREIASSKRTLSLSVVPKVLEESELTLRILGLDEGNYHLCVSGSDPELVTAGRLAEGFRIRLPAVIGVEAEALNENHQEWLRRIDNGRALAAELGYSTSDTPSPIREAVDNIQALGEGLEEAVSAREAIIRVTPQDTGPVALPFPEGISAEELEKRKGILAESSRELIQRISALEEEGNLRREILDTLVPVEFGKPSGSLAELASSGKSGTGELVFAVSNPSANPLIRLRGRMTAPSGGSPLGETEFNFRLGPGESRTVKAPFEISESGHSGRFAIPVELTIEVGGVEIVRRAGIGFGHDFIRKWRMIGPFGNPKNRGVDLVYPPEEEVDLQASHEGMEGNVNWTEVEATDRGYMDLKLVYEPNTNCLAYGAVWIYSPRAEPVVCACGSNDGIQVWMNDHEVFRFAGERGANPAEDLFPARLKKGWNRLMVKSLQTGGNWGFYFEVRDSAGATASDWEFSTLPPD